MQANWRAAFHSELQYAQAAIPRIDLQGVSTDNYSKLGAIKDVSNLWDTLFFIIQISLNMKTKQQCKTNIYWRKKSLISTWKIGFTSV